MLLLVSMPAAALAQTAPTWSELTDGQREILEPLADRAKETLRRLGYDNVTVRAGDGYRGWPEQAPFDAIVVTAAPEEVPEPLKQQLKIGGRLVAIVGDAPVMEARRVTRVNELGFDTRSLFETSLPPLQNAPHPERFHF